jgi:3-oxoacyl-[acyl-carrier protein] reductase
MDLGLTGKVAIVGGGSDGLGFAIANRLLAEGVHVAFFARRAEKVAAAERQLADTYGGERVLGLAADCSRAADLERVTALTLERFGDAVHVLVTNDGGPPIRRISELTDEVWLQAFERHFFYVVRSVRDTLPLMTAEGGSILNAVSAVARRSAVGMAAPTTVWSAVIGYAQTLALEVAARNINVNTLLAGQASPNLTRSM